jgi:hypothetical protein
MNRQQLVTRGDEMHDRIQRIETIRNLISDNIPAGKLNLQEIEQLSTAIHEGLEEAEDPESPTNRRRRSQELSKRFGG